jgi:hypothetical protein
MKILINKVINTLFKIGIKILNDETEPIKEPISILYVFIFLLKIIFTALRIKKS